MVTLNTFTPKLGNRAATANTVGTLPAQSVRSASTQPCAVRFSEAASYMALAWRSLPGGMVIVSSALNNLAAFGVLIIELLGLVVGRVTLGIGKL